MHTAASLVEERPFVMNAEHFRTGIVGFELLSYEARDPFDAAAGVIRAGRHGSSDEGRCSMARERAGDYGHSFVGAFHDVVTACAMDVDVDESRNGGLLYR